MDIRDASPSSSSPTVPGVLAGAEPRDLRQADDHEAAAWLATAAGELLLSLRSHSPGVTGRELGALGDQRSQAFLAAGLEAARPGDPVLSEEALDDPARLTAERVWIVDPLDGTREFGEEGRTDWAVHVALWAGGDLVAGAVALPAQGRTLATPRPLPEPPASSPQNTSVASSPRLVVSRSRPPAWVPELAERIGGTTVPLGSAGAKAAAVIIGQAEAYVHAGGQYEWDSAAPVAVARAAGLHTSRLDGSPLRYNRPDPLLPDLLICQAPLATTILPAVRELIAVAGPDA